LHELWNPAYVAATILEPFDMFSTVYLGKLINSSQIYFHLQAAIF
jgi:hypothetical protein